MKIPFLRVSLSTTAWLLVIPWLLASRADAFNPPVDRAGPLVARIEAPEEVKQVEVANSVRVILENRGDKPVQGTLEIGLTDHWSVKPEGPVKFAVEGGGKASYEFQVVAGRGTYSAQYPIHAYARFESEGKRLVAHPIHILHASLPQPPRTGMKVDWRPVAAPASGELALWRLPAIRPVIAVFGRTPKVMPCGWQGSEAETGGTMNIANHTLSGISREAIQIHPPWQKGLVGTLVAECPIALPKTTPIRLTFANGVIPDGHGDGVTFRVRVAKIDAPDGELGKALFERHTASHQWEPGEADLSPFAGQTIRLQLESHPGPRNDTGWDASFWAEPVLVVGTPTPASPFPPKDTANSVVLGQAGRGAKPYEVRIWPGKRGLLDAIVGFQQGEREVCFRGFEVRVLGGRIDDARSPILLKETQVESTSEGYRVRHRFESQLGPIDLAGRLWIERGALKAQFKLENAPAPKPWQVVWLEDLAAGPWSDAAATVYAGMGNAIRTTKPFRLGFDGHQLSTSFVGFDFRGGVSVVQGVDVVPDHFDAGPQERRYSLHAPHASTFTYIPADNIWDAVKGWREVNGLKAAGGVEKAAGRFVFDLWGGRYRHLRENLEQAFRYGLTDSMAIIHDWQRWGYDYRLPDLYPPNPDKGTIDDLRQLIAAGKKAGVPIALHDNYIDYYPDADGFSYDKHIAFQADGQPVRAWLNDGRGAQSYRFRADAVAPFLRRNLQWIRDGLGPTAYFIDVWSSIGPYDYWTADGKFFDRVYTRTSWGEHFAWIRNLLGDNAPQISESGHDQLIGWLDGAQTNHLRVGKPGPSREYGSWCVWNLEADDAERVPWFDAAHHDRFILHGAGYPGRYEGGLDSRLHGIYSDDYIATEVLTGHPAIVPSAFGRDVVRKYWLLHDLMRALALRQIDRVNFHEGDLHRQEVLWSGGARVWVNRGESDWMLEGAVPDQKQIVLPPFGFLALVPIGEGKVVEASIVRRDGVITETARSPEQLYVNGRQLVDGPLPIRVTVEKTRATGPRKAELTLNWQADAPIPAGWTPFMHFCEESGEIAFQGGHQPGVFATSREGTFTATVSCAVPENAKAGAKFELRAGIYNPKTGERLALSGADDRTRRIRLGEIRVEGKGDSASLAWKSRPEESDPALARQNPGNKPIDFGAVVTSGGCRLTRDASSLVVTPLPAARPVKTVAKIRWTALPWKLTEPTQVAAIAADGRVMHRQSVRRDGDHYVLEFAPGVFQYRFITE